MAELRVKITLRLDGEVPVGFPLERRFTANEPQVVDYVCPASVTNAALNGLAGFGTLLRFDEAAEVRPDPNLATPLNLRADSVVLCTKSATLVSFTPSTASRVRGVV